MKKIAGIILIIFSIVLFIMLLMPDIYWWENYMLGIVVLVDFVVGLGLLIIKGKDDTLRIEIKEECNKYWKERNKNE